MINSRLLMSIMAIVPATALSFSIAVFIPGTYPAYKNDFIYFYSLYLFLFGLATLSTNYVYMLRFPMLHHSQALKEFTAIFLFRIISSILIVVVISLVFKNILISLSIGCWLLVKNIEESLINYHRANSHQKNILMRSIFAYTPDTALVILNYFIIIEFFSFIIILIAINIIILIYFIRLDYSLFSPFKIKELSIIDYAKNAVPLGLSALRETFSVNGAVLAASLIFPPGSLASINFFLRYYRLSAIISSSLSNFFIQDYVRGTHRFKDLFVVIALIVSCHLFQYFIVNSSIFSIFVKHIFTENLPFFLSGGPLLYTFAMLIFGIIQIRLIVDSKRAFILVFELVWIFAMILFFYFSIEFYWLFWYSQILSFVFAFVLCKILFKVFIFYRLSSSLK
jgi:hypothetical protein